ncbi:protein HflC [endosymbiont of Euscepes postfasciatus]|uniref:SPFH domain-containing protein n=1 Tax=endosymbiont of Euscepes postfasciatus TaxID=650377 RepID=UPI000DC703D1|nr:SPFH domain-containing protein [endosymbiont of Euscepes postfasciatus]BBA84589.1 protein HflC [endosymbiont of Euscepes postfasciatus]
MKVNYKKFFIFIFLILIIKKSLFIIPEENIGICSRLGKILKNNKNEYIIFNPGLNIKIPYIDKIEIINKNLQIIHDKVKCETIDKKNIIVNYYIKYKIFNINSYYKNTENNYYVIENVLKNKTNIFLKDKISSLYTKNILNNLNLILKKKNIFYDKNINKILLFGIDGIDIKIYKIILDDDFYKYICDKMKLEQKKIFNKNILKIKLKHIKNKINIYYKYKNKMLKLNKLYNLQKKYYKYQ